VVAPVLAGDLAKAAGSALAQAAVLVAQVAARVMAAAAQD
jgi:hypothetical protein